MGLTVTEDTPADMLAGNMELLVQLPPRNDDDYDDDNYDGDSHHRNHHRHHNHHHNGHQRRTSNGNARRVVVARSTPMMDLLVQVATSQKLSASSYTLEAIGEHGLVLTHHPNTPIGALDALQVKLLPKQGTFVPMKARHVNQPFETTFRLQVHLPRNQLYVSRVSSRMNLGKILDEVCREKNLDRNKYELCHPGGERSLVEIGSTSLDFGTILLKNSNIEETLDLSLSLQDYHLQEVTLCPKRRSLGSSLSSQDIMALQRQEERRRQDAKQSVFGFAFKKSKESSLSTDSLGERSVSPTRSDGTGRSASPLAPTAPTRPQRKRRPAPKPPMAHPGPEPKTSSNSDSSGGKETEETLREGAERIIISHSRNSSDSSGYHEASVLSDNPESNIRVPETLPRRGRLLPPQESPVRTLAESSQASKSLSNLAAVQPAPRIARVTSNSSLSSAGGLRKKKAAPAPPPPRPLSSAISTQALERIVDSEESFTAEAEPVAPEPKATSHEPPASPETEIDPERRESVQSTPEAAPPSIPIPKVAVDPVVETPSDSRRVGVDVPVPKPRGAVSRLESVASSAPVPETLRTKNAPVFHRISQFENNVDVLSPKPIPKERGDRSPSPKLNSVDLKSEVKVPRKPRRKTLSSSELDEETDPKTEKKDIEEPREEKKNDKTAGTPTDRIFDDLIMRQNVRRLIKVEEKIGAEESTAQISEGKRSCAVISTIPKCDRFVSPEIVRKQIPSDQSARKRGEDDRNHSLTPKVSFGGGKSILESDYQQGLGNGSPSVTVDEVATNGTDDELELGDLEMFERSRDFPKLANLARSHSELNNFEINTFEGSGRPLTSRSGDFTFAMNPNLARRVIPGSLKSDSGSVRHDRMRLSPNDATMPGTKSQKLSRNGAPQLPAFLTTSITWEREDLLRAVQNDSRSTASRLGQPDSEEETKSLSLNGNAESPTSDLLKKVSDTLSESLRSPETSLANDREPQRCVDEPQAPIDDGINEAKPLSEKSEGYVGSIETVSTETDGIEFLENQQTPVVKQLQNTNEQPPSTIDWEYPIPEPPSEFRDNAVVELPAKKTLFIPEDGTKEAARPNRVDIRPEEPAVRARTVSVTSSESRRGSHASSPPTVAPVDNTLSNFVITTYSRPKNVDIFDEVRPREVETPISRKSSGTGLKPSSIIVEEVRKVAESWPSVSIAEEKSSIFIPEERHVESSNVKISIATKPRPRADSIEAPKPRIVQVEIAKGDESLVPKEVIAPPAEETNGNQKFSKWRDDILKRHETPDKETQLQSAQVLKSILPQLEGIQRSSPTHVVAVEKSASNPTEEPRVIAAVPKTEESSPNREPSVDQTLPVSPPKEPATKRYTYAGPPAIDLGSWSDRSRTTKVQIKPDSDYKVETSRSIETSVKETPSMNKERSSTVTVNKTSGTTTVLLQNSSTTLLRKSSVTSRFEKESKEQPNELAKVMRVQSNGGFRRPASIAVDPSRDGDKELQRIFGGGDRRDEIAEKEDEVDTRPISFKDLKQAFAKDQNSGSASIPKYGGYPRRVENSGPKFIVRRDSFNSSNAEPENSVQARINKPLGSSPEKRSFVAPAANNFRNGFQEATRKTSRGTLMPVVKGFKSVVSEEEEKRNAHVNRIAIGDISNGNYVSNQNGLRKTVHIRVEDTNGVPKPPTMPVITGVTLKTTNYNSNIRPKSMPAAEPDDRNQLLESIRNFGTDQLKRVPRRNTNVVGMTPGSRPVRS